MITNIQRENSRIKVVHIVTALDLGGSERVAINIAKSTNENFSYYVVEVKKGCSHFNEYIKKELRESDVQYITSPIKNTKLAILIFPFWFISVFLKIRPDIIHVHTETPDLAIFLFRKLTCFIPNFKSKYIRTIHNTKLWTKWKWIGKIVETYYISHQSNIAISKGVQKSYCREYRCDKPPIIYNGIMELIQGPFPIELNHKKINILFAGRMEMQKGIDYLVEIVKTITDDRIEFYLIGSGSMEGMLREKVGNQKNVHIFDKIYNLSKYLYSFDYLLMPSRHEGLALLCIEASFAHLPSIISDCEGLTETLPFNWPLIVKNNSIDDYVKIINNLENLDRNTLANDAYHYVKDKFSIDKMRFDYEKYYEQILV